MTTKSVTVSVSGTALSAWSVTGAPVIVSTADGVELDAAPLFSETADSLVYELGRKVFEEEDAWANDDDLALDPDGPGFDFSGYEVVSTNVNTTAYVPSNVYQRLVLRVTAIKAGYPDLVAFSDYLGIAPLVVVGGDLTVSSTSVPINFSAVLTITDTLIYERQTLEPLDEESLDVYLVAADGTRTLVPPDTPPVPATVAFVGAASSTSLGALPTHGAGNLAISWITGNGLDVAPAVAAGWVVAVNVLSNGESNTRRAALLWKALAGADTPAPPVLNGNRFNHLIMDDTSLTSPVITPVVSVEPSAVGTMPFGALADLPAGSWVGRAAHLEQKVGAFPAATAGMTRHNAGIVSVETWNRMTLETSNGIDLAIDAAAPALEATSRSVTVTFGVRPAEAP